MAASQALSRTLWILVCQVVLWICLQGSQFLGHVILQSVFVRPVHRSSGMHGECVSLTIGVLGVLWLEWLTCCPIGGVPGRVHHSWAPWKGTSSISLHTWPLMWWCIWIQCSKGKHVARGGYWMAPSPMQIADLPVEQLLLGFLPKLASEYVVNRSGVGDWE